MRALPTLTQFRLELSATGVAHLIFDAPERTMNVFSEAAIVDIGAFAAWLKRSDVKGAVIRSGKSSAFCAGADLNELGVAYDMIMAAPKADRGRIAFDHFVRLSRAFRALETSGKPVAAAIAGIALGGGCELALACHHRVLVDDPRIALGLPESLVGLLPGAGGTQRLPRLIGAEAALPLLLQGARLGGQDALDIGLVDRLVAPGDEIAAAELWVLSGPEARQPWDRDDWSDRDPETVAPVIRAARNGVLDQTHGHYPAPLAILDCIERGLPQPFGEALRIEMEIFAALIQRPEPRNMIRTRFLGKLDFERRTKAGDAPPETSLVVAALKDAIGSEIGRFSRDGRSVADIDVAFDRAGFTSRSHDFATTGTLLASGGDAGPGEESAELWFEQAAVDETDRIAAPILLASARAAATWIPRIAPADQPAVDFEVSRSIGFPDYLGGPIGLARYLGSDRLSELYDRHSPDQAT